MSNPTFTGSPITFQAAERIEKFTLVKLNAGGTVSVAGAGDKPFGVVTEIADPGLTTKPTNIAVHYGGCTIKLRAKGGKADGFKAGAPVYVADNGEVATSGATLVGVAARDGERGTVLTVLNALPAVASATGTVGGES